MRQKSSPFNTFKEKIILLAKLRTQEFKRKRAGANERMWERYRQAMRFMKCGDGCVDGNKR